MRDHNSGDHTHDDLHPKPAIFLLSGLHPRLTEDAVSGVAQSRVRDRAEKRAFYGVASGEMRDERTHQRTDRSKRDLNQFDFQGHKSSKG